MAGLNRHRFERKRLNEVFAWGRSIATRRRGVLAWPIAAQRGRIEPAGGGGRNSPMAERIEPAGSGEIAQPPKKK